jgi:DNA polymerase III gamma/tau subunit
MIYNWNIIGHDKQLKMLEADIESGNLAHSYLLYGAGHVGKYTVAKKLASILQCENNFCGVCPTCIQIRKGIHLDTMEYENNKEALKIDQIREIISRCNMSSQSRYKVVVLQSIGRMTVEASNALLKTLEEPPGRTLFIMTTSNVQEVLPTILSRSRLIKFHLFSTEFLANKLRELYPESTEETINQVAKLSLGRAGRALDLMNQPEMLAYFLKLYKDTLYLLDTDNIVEKFAYVENLVEDEKMKNDFLNVMTHVLRNKMLEANPGRERKGFIEMAAKVQEAFILLKKNVNARLVLENLMLLI